MSQPIDPTESLPAGVAGRINPVCDRFEAAWQTGGRPRLEEFLPDGEAADQPWLLRDLLRLELYYRGRSGETPTAEEYRRRLPDHAALIEKAFAALPTADPHATRYSDTPAIADPHATRYSDPPAVEAPSSRLPRRFGGYELLEEIGHGGMGVVYKARQFSPERLVALKVIRAGQLADEEDVRRFRQEADEAARLDHPNIVPVYEVGEQDGLHFFTMKLVEGGGLDKHLERYRNNPKAAARLLATAARAVHHAHQRQLLHRDLKPGNILLDAAGQPHVADFGLAKRMEGDVAAMTRSNAIVGTPEYMAPEQAGGEKRLTTAVDVYALGGVLYALLTGRPPFQAKALLDVLGKVVSEAPAPPSKVRPGVPRDLETICLKCLAKEPAKRYGSAEALAEDLERWQKGEPVRARPAGGWERGWKWVRRHPAQAAAAGLLLAFVIALLVGGALSAYFAVEANANYLDARRREKDANDALGKLAEREKQISGAKAELEVTLAQSLLRPLGHDTYTPHPSEIDAVWQLAALSPAQERVRILFVEQALANPRTAEQLRNRADMAVHAALGLDPARRRKAEQALMARLQDPACDFDVQTDCGLIGSDSDDWSPEFTRAASRHVAAALSKTNDRVALVKLSKALVASAARMGPDEAAAAARLVVEAMGKTTDDQFVLPELSDALAALAVRMGPDEAAAAARLVVEAMGMPNNHDALSYLSEALTASAARMGPDEAAAAARLVVEAMGMTNESIALVKLSKALAALAPRMGPDEAARLSSMAARPVVKAIAGKPTDPFALPELSEALTALAAWMGPDEAAAAAHVVVEAMGMPNNHDALSDLSDALAALAARMGPDEAARLSSVAARLVVEAMGMPNNHDALSDLSEALAALAARMGPDEAARLSSMAGRMVVEAMDKEKKPNALSHLSEALALLAARMGPDEAARLSSMAARLVVRAMGETHNSFDLFDLSEALASLAARMGPDEAAAAARLVVEAMGMPNNHDALSKLSKALAALAARMGPDEAARQSSMAARLVVEAMGMTNDPGALSHQSKALAALAARMGPDEAARLSSVAARLVVEAMGGKTNNPFALPELSDALLALAAWMGPDEAAAAARRVVEAMGETNGPDALPHLSEALAALAARMGPDEAARLLSMAARLVVEAMGKWNSPDSLSHLSEALAALAARMGPDEAAAAARRVVEAMGETNGPDALSHLSEALAALAARMGPDEAAHRSTVLVGASGTVAAPQNLWAGLAELTENSPLPPERFTEQQLVDLLKMPTCRREARQVLVRQLGWQCGQHFDNMWDFVEWARVNRPDLDLTSPPVRTETPGPKP